MLDPIKPAQRSQSLTNCILGVGLTPNAGRRRRTLRPNRLLGPEPRLEGEAAHRAGRRSPDAQFDHVEMSDILAEDPVELGAERVVAAERGGVHAVPRLTAEVTPRKQCRLSAIAPHGCQRASDGRLTLVHLDKSSPM